jgi:hypothetical protein
VVEAEGRLPENSRVKSELVYDTSSCSFALPPQALRQSRLSKADPTLDDDTAAALRHSRTTKVRFVGKLVAIKHLLLFERDNPDAEQSHYAATPPRKLIDSDEE